MVPGEETGAPIVDKAPVTPKENEALLTMLRTRWVDGAFSDIKVIIFEREYLLHRMVLCRSSFFSRLLQGEWNETHEKILRLEVPATAITCEAFELSLSHMYANPIELNRSNVFQVMAAASYLDLQDLCTQCSTFITESMHDPDAFLEFYRSGMDFEYGEHSDRIKKSGWHHLCMMGVDHLRQVLPDLDVQTIKRLLVSDEFWVRSELERYKLVKEVLFPKLSAAREQCREHGGIDGMPLWSMPSLGSPRDPWVMSDGSSRSKDKAESSSSNNQGSTSTSQNHLLDSAEIKEESPGGSDAQGITADPATKQDSLEQSDLHDDNDHLSQGDHTHEQRTEEEGIERSSMTTGKETTEGSIKEEQDRSQGSAFGCLDSREDATEHMGVRDAAMGVRDVFHAVADVLGLEGIKYSHIQHADLSKIEIELHEMGLNRAHHALLQGMRTQDILYKRIELCSAQEEGAAQAGRNGSYPRNLHPYNQKDLQELYSRWWLPSFRFGVEFADVKNITPQTEQISEPHYYAGSVWKVRLLIDDTKNEVRLHLFRNQRKIGKIGGMQVTFDSREVVCTRFKFLVPSRDGMAARSSRPGRFQQKKGRGWNDFLHLDDIESFLTPWGSLRVIVIVYPPFETD